MFMFLKRFINVKDQEVPAVLWSFAYFFCLLCGYYILRPVRDEMGIMGGVENLQWVFTGTFVAMLGATPIFGAAVKRFHRHVLLPVVYIFFIANLLIFYGFFQYEIAAVSAARAFFIWVSVFNLFVVSVFWSFMVDLFSNAQARRLFGFIAAGGSVGAILGPFLTATLAPRIGPIHLLLISALFLAMAVLCIKNLIKWADKGVNESGPLEKPSLQATTSNPHKKNDEAIGGGLLAGISLLFRSPYLMGIGFYILLYTSISTFLYFEQAQIIRDAFDDSSQRTSVFAIIDLSVNFLTVITQVFLTHRFVARFGLSATLALIPGAMLIGFTFLGMAPVLGVLLVFQVIRRAGNYAFAKPAREMLFTVVRREEKYKAKNFIDTVVYRGGDAVSGWVFAGLTSVGLGLSSIAFIAMPIAFVWLLTGVWLGGRQEKLRMNLLTQTK
ncbi:MAG TPA: Npt1/Npt2 family nucleotide transporter [Nitrospiria bacterium]|jgi:AAA family ATP:ADP antiporter